MNEHHIYVGIGYRYLRKAYLHVEQVVHHLLRCHVLNNELIN